MATAISTLLQRFQQQEESAKAANIQRYEQAMAIYDEIISRYRPGGEFGAAALGQLEARKVTDVGRETQQLISSGLYGTTTMGATGRRWEEAVGAPERLRLEDIQMQRLSEAQVGKAGFIERREDIGPDPGLIAQLAMQAGQTYGMGGYGDYQAAPEIDKGPSPWEAGFMGGGWTLGGGVGRGAVTPTVTTQPTRGAGPTPGERGVDIPMAPGVGGTYYGAAYKGEREAAPTAPAAGGDITAYQGWAAEMRRRYPTKPVMPMSRWQRLVKPKMGATYGQFAGGTYGQAST